ncbi:MAG: hypothetical protein A2Y75_02010 [Candidatus Solincola sediminis]|uniref:Transglutaminase-like domain-containing protein n=1 Tax=Candidatus Solincola sediminis TaxID=1797199 RepID=A0A1F2WJU8_9ACTN|nr:MAG: hypothetical protein A2Y75_02010 [Candidatus Solincola sediminis]
MRIKPQTKMVLTIILIIVLLGSTTGLIFTLTSKKSEAKGAPKLNVDVYVRPEVVTAAYKIYGDNAMGYWLANTKIENTGTVPVTNFSISYKIEGYCDWTSAELYPQIIPGEIIRDYCWPTFTASTMKEISTKSPAELTVRYEYDGLDKPIDKQEKFFFLGKNDFIWSYIKEEEVFAFQDLNDNYPLLAAFVTKNDETVQQAAKAIYGGLAPSTDADTYYALVRTFDVLRAYGMQYVYEPSVLEANTFGQYIQYPADSLNRVAGTCIDLSILFCALLESVSIKTYIYLIPGHAIPAVLMPESGYIYPIESTFMDLAFVQSHYDVNPQITADECIDIAIDYINQNVEEGTYIKMDVGQAWDNGVMPAW